MMGVFCNHNTSLKLKRRFYQIVIRWALLYLIWHAILGYKVILCTNECSRDAHFLLDVWDKMRSEDILAKISITSIENKMQ